MLSRLAQPAPARTPFLEVRTSELLDAPMRIQGEYLRPDEAALVRQVQVPYAETTTIRGNRVTIERGTRAPRRFSLARAPELAGLQASFGALLSGDQAALERAYRIQTLGAPAAWRMQLAPRDAAVAARVSQVVLYGRQDALRCIQTTLASGEVQRTLLGDAVAQAGEAVTPETVAQLCHDGQAG